MKNYGIRRFKSADVNNFTSNKGMKIRRKINKPFSKLLKTITKFKLINSSNKYQKSIKFSNNTSNETTKQKPIKIDNKYSNKSNKKKNNLSNSSGIKIMNYPNLDKNKPYIFASLHNFVDDSIANLSTLDHNSYLLFGTSDQLDVNKDMYAAWANGFIYVDRKDEKSRKDSILKMQRLLENGNSVLIFPEGGLNNTENLFCQKLFGVPYYLSRLTKAEVVPVAPLYEYGSNKIFMNIGNPIDLSTFTSKQEANIYLRDCLSTLLYDNLLANSEIQKRADLGKDPRMDFMEQRKNEYMKTKWTKDVWDEELTRYLDKEDTELFDIWEQLSNVEINEKTAQHIAPVLVRKREEEKYNFKDYMHNNWNKK